MKLSRLRSTSTARRWVTCSSSGPSITEIVLRSSSPTRATVEVPPSESSICTVSVGFDWCSERMGNGCPPRISSVSESLRP